MNTIPDPRYVTLDSAGNGSVYFRGLRPGIYRQIKKITVETTYTGSGTVSVYFRGQLVTTKAIALLMTAAGSLNVAASEEVEVRFVSGAHAAEFKVTAHYVEQPADAAGAETGLVFGEAVGFAEPVDEPVLLLDDYVSIGNGDVYSSAFLDMRAFNSYHCAIELGNGTFNATDMANIRIFHFDKPDQGPSEPNVWADHWYLYADGIGSERMFQDAVRGGWMYFAVDPVPATVRTAELFIRVWGSYRSVPQLGIRNSTGLPGAGTNVLYDTSTVFGGAGGTNVANAKIGVGKARARLEGTASGATMLIEYGSAVSPLRDTLTLAAAGLTEKEIFLPTRQARVTITNGAAANTVRAQIIQDRITQ